MSIESIIILVYAVGAVASYKFVVKMATEKTMEENRKGKVKDDTAYAVLAFTVLVSVALWPILVPMRLRELASERISSIRKPVKAVATKRRKRRR